MVHEKLLRLLPGGKQQALTSDHVFEPFSGLNPLHYNPYTEVSCGTLCFSASMHTRYGTGADYSLCGCVMLLHIFSLSRLRELCSHLAAMANLWTFGWWLLYIFHPSSPALTSILYISTCLASANIKQWLFGLLNLYLLVIYLDKDETSLFNLQYGCLFYLFCSLFGKQQWLSLSAS